MHPSLSQSKMVAATDEKLLTFPKGSWLISRTAPSQIPHAWGGSVLSIRRHGSGTCQDPQGSVPVRGPDGNVDQVSVSWTLTQCNLKTGVFRIFVQPRKLPRELHRLSLDPSLKC